jgi:hypothetical protein
MESTAQILKRLIDTSTVAVLQIRTAKGVLSVEARFLKEGNREGDRGIWVRLAGGGSDFIEKMIESAAPVLAQADDGPRRLTFVSSFIARKRGLISGEQVLLAWPGEIKSQERRKSARERIGDDAEVRAALIGHGGKSVREGSVAVQVWDLSADGACVVCMAKTVGKIQMEDVLQLQLRFGEKEYRVSTKVCRVQDAGKGLVRLGMRFENENGDAEFRGRVAHFLEELKSRRVRRSLNQTFGKVA